MDITRMLRRLAALRPGEPEEGQGLVEYALIILLISLVVISALGAFGGSLAVIYQFILDSWPA